MNAKRGGDLNGRSAPLQKVGGLLHAFQLARQDGDHLGGTDTFTEKACGFFQGALCIFLKKVLRDSKDILLSGFPQEFFHVLRGDHRSWVDKNKKLLERILKRGGVPACFVDQPARSLAVDGAACFPRTGFDPPRQVPVEGRVARHPRAGALKIP